MGIRLERVDVAASPHASGPFLRDQLRPYVRARHRTGGSVADGVSGWGEVTAGENPFYNEEWTDAAWLLLKNYIAPRVLGQEFETR